MATKTHEQKVLSKLGKRPKSATDIAKSLGYDSHHAVSRVLGSAVKSGSAVKTDKGYAKP